MVFAAWSLAAIWTAISPVESVSKADITQKRAEVLKRAIAKYRSYSGGVWPTALGDLVSKGKGMAACSFNTTTKVLSGWCGPYIDVAYSGDTSYRRDGYGTELSYSSAGATVTSCGKNKVCGGASVSDDTTYSL